MATARLIACLASSVAIKALGTIPLAREKTVPVASIVPIDREVFGCVGLQDSFPDCRCVDPSGVGRVECPLKTPPADAVRVACVGDSITAGLYASDATKSYPAQLQRLLDATHGEGKYSVQNLGASDTSLEVDTPAPYVRSAQFKALASGTWDVIVIMLGTNDGKRLMPECAPGLPITACPFAADYTAFVEFCAKLGRLGNAPSIYIMVPPPLMRDYPTPPGAGVRQSVVNSVLPDVIPALFDKNPHVTAVIDIFSLMGGSSAWPSVFPPQGCTLTSFLPACAWFCDAQNCNQVHPNNRGYEHMAKYIGSILNVHFGESTFTARILDPAPGARQLLSNEVKLI